MNTNQYAPVRTMRRAVRRMLLASMAIALTLPVVSALAAGNPPYIPASADWLTTVNYYRSMAGLGPVTEDASLSAGATQHSCYMLANGMSHDEVPGKPGYTTTGDEVGNSSNVAVTTAFNQTARNHIELWMTGPFHTIGILRPGLATAGFGKCDDAAATPWRSAATLDVLHGLGDAPALTTPILFPGDGASTNLDRFVAETPDPRTYCGYSGTVGLPVIAMMPEAVTGSVTATITGPTGAIPTCALSANNTDGEAQAILQGDNAVVALPSTILATGTYSVKVVTGARTVAWTFSVDPAAKDGVQAPIVVPTADPSATALAFEPLTPVRIVDTRENLGTGRLAAQVATRIQIAGKGTVPAKAQAISANFTVTGTTGAGYLTVWNCAADRPVASTVNFGAGDTVPNAASVPLDATGGICVYSPVGTDLVVDVSGYYGAKASAHFAPMTPVRLMDTRTGFGGTTRLAAGQTAALKVAGTNGIPAASKAVVLNVTTVDPAAAGFVTVFPCDQARPLAAALNPTPGDVRANLVISPVSADGRVCLFTLNDVDLVVDATGYLTTSQSTFTATAPFRFTDTRESRSVVLNAGTGGRAVQLGATLVLQIAGQRGVPAGTKAVSVNIAVTDATGAGFVTAFPCGTRPTTSNVNFNGAKAVSTGALVPLSSTGQLCVYVSSPTQVIVDVNGWWG